MRQIEGRFLWEQPSIFLFFRHIAKRSWEVFEAKTDHFSVWIHLCTSVCVCWCVLLVLNHIQDWSVVTTVPKLQVSLSTFGPNTQLLNPGKCFQPELGYRKAAQTSEQRQECPSSSKGSIWPFLYLQLNMPRLEGREGASVRKGWGMMEEREEAGLEFQHLLELYLQPILQQYWLKKRWIPLLPCMVLISALVLGQCWFTDGP